MRPVTVPEYAAILFVDLNKPPAEPVPAGDGRAGQQRNLRYSTGQVPPSVRFGTMLSKAGKRIRSTATSVASAAMSARSKSSVKSSFESGRDGLSMSAPVCNAASAPVFSTTYLSGGAQSPRSGASSPLGIEHC